MSNQVTVSVDDICEANAPAIYVSGGLKPFIEQVRQEVSVEVPDLSTKKGRDRIASLAAKVSKSKVAVEKPGREYLKRLKEMPKVVESELRDFVREMDALRDETRKPLTEWEAAEQRRISNHQEGIDQINMRLECRDLDSTELAINIEWLEGMAIDESWEEFEPEALRAKDKALTALREALAARQKYEAEQAELEELRRKQTEQEQRDREAAIAREAEERACREVEQQAQAEREAAAKREADARAAAERRELELKLQAEQSAKRELEAQQRAEQAERDAEAKAQAAAAAERQRQADEQARIEAEIKAREDDKEHKARVMGEAKGALMSMNITEELARAIVLKIARREIPNVSITF